MNYFGTDGIRTKMDSSFEKNVFVRVGEYFSSSKKRLKILLAMDTRKNGPYLKSLLLSGLLKKCDVIDLGVCSTPALSYLLSINNFDFGIMISASHNPSNYNGIKILDNKGMKITNRLQKSIEKFIDSDKTLISFNGTYSFQPGLIRVYEEFLIRSFYIDLDFKIAFDCANGATSKIVKDILPYFSFDGDSYFTEGDINKDCGATDLKNLKRIVKQGNYDLGMAFDGDGDRIQIIYNDRIIDGDDLLIYFAKKLDKDCVLTKITRRDTKEQISSLKKKIEIVDVGDSHIASFINNHPNFIGGETSGHIILSKKHITGDGLYVGLMFLSLLNNKSELEDAFVNKKYIYEPLKYKKTCKMFEKGYLNTLKKNYYKITKDKYTKFRFSGTEDVLRVIVEANSKKELKQKKEVLDSLI